MIQNGKPAELKGDEMAAHKRGMTRRAEIYGFIMDYKRKNDGNSPSLSEIQNGVGISSKSLVNFHLMALVRKNAIEIRNGRIVVRGGMWMPPADFVKYTEM